MEDSIERLHQTNRVRHEVQLRYESEREANEALNITLKQKLMVIESRDLQIQELEHKVREEQARVEQVQLQLMNAEKLHELKVGTLNSRIEQVLESLANEKALRETWCEKYESE